MFKTNCSGDETTLLNCSYITQLNFGSNCSASENARVICQGIVQNITGILWVLSLTLPKTSILIITGVEMREVY